MDARIKCLNEMKKLQKKMADTNCRHLDQQYEKVYSAYTEVLTMMDNLIFKAPKESAKPKARRIPTPIGSA